MRFVPYRTAVVLGVFAAACASEAPTPTASGLTESTPAFAAEGRGPLADRYIVVFRPGTPSADELTTQLARGGTVHYRYSTVFQGFAASLPSEALEGIRRNPNVELVEADAVVTTTETQSNATWGLDRIDQTARPLNGSYTYSTTAANVTAYILDTGILAGHTDFGGRVSGGWSAIVDGNGTKDCNGHGTHVAGTVGGATWGVAKGVKLVPVRVLGCDGSGTYAGVIAGIDWVAANAAKPAVANMSLGGGASTTVDNAVAAAVTAGVTFVVAAGNSNRSACQFSPARAAAAITVGATTNTDTDTRASYSNYGSCLDIFAPGSSIKSAWYTNTTATNTISGTSMASPHVAGAAALYLADNPNASPSAVATALTSAATKDVVTSAGNGSPNLLLFVGAGGGGGGGDQITAHVASLTGSPTVRRNNWSASVTIAVADTDGASVAGAVVSGSFTGGSTVSCTTGSAGTCTVTSPNYKTNVLSTTYTVSGIGGTGIVYDASKNSPASGSIPISQP